MKFDRAMVRCGEAIQGLVGRWYCVVMCRGAAFGSGDVMLSDVKLGFG